jgi:hypothetical protein
LLLSGTALFLCAEDRLRMPPVAVLAPAFAVALLGSVTAAQYAAGFDAGIDELLFRDRAHAYNDIPGRMSPYTAAAFMLFGAGMAALHTRRLRRLGQVASCLVGLIGVGSLLGYLWNASDIITDDLLPPVAVHTAIALVLLAAGMLLVAEEFQAVQRTAKARTEIEARVLGAFIGVVLLLALAGRYTVSGQRAASFTAAAPSEQCPHRQRMRSNEDGSRQASRQAAASGPAGMARGAAALRWRRHDGGGLLPRRRSVPQQFHPLAPAAAHAS